MDIAWRNLRVSASNGRVLLNDVSGYAQRGQITAVMGPSGSGKSTLLDALAGRLAKNTTRAGSIFINGHLQWSIRHGIAAYVKQDDTGLIGSLTVLETISFSAKLRLPSSLSWGQKMEVVENVISEMGLKECQDTVIGNWHRRGLSVGEKRRVSIALEILTQPSLLLLDESTSGLDSAAAYFVMKTIRNLAHGSRKTTVITSLQQPGSEVFDQFDNLCLLSQGNLVYFGKTTIAEELFVKAGFPCPYRRNPSDHYLRAINSDFDAVQRNVKDEVDIQICNGNQLSTTEAVKVLITTFRSHYLPSLTHTVDSLCDTKTDYAIHSELRPNTILQIVTLTKRSFKNMTRDLGYYWIRIFVYFMLSLVIGSIYFDVGTSFLSIASRISCISFIGCFLTFMSIGGFPSFVEDVKVFLHEKQNGHYGVLAFSIANTLSSIPYLFLISLGSTSIFYNMVTFHPGFDHFAYFALNVFAAVAVVESLMMCIASVVPNFLMGVICGAGIVGIFILVDGSSKLPKFWKYPLHYIAFHTYSLRGLFQNDFEGLKFENSDSAAILSQYEIDISLSKWTNLGILFAMIILYRAIFVLLVKLNPKLEHIKEWITARFSKI